MRYAFRLPALSLLLLVGLGTGTAGAAPGELDRSFGGDGKVPRDLGGYDYVADVAAQPDRTVMALVQYEADDDFSVAVVRFGRDGRFDRRFGDRGLAQVAVAGDEYPGGIALQPNGRVVVSFTSDPQGADRAFGIARFRGNGNPDVTLDRDGVQTAGFGTGFFGATARDVALDGTDVVAVGSVFSDAGTRGDFAIARFKPGGGLDESFAGDGRQTTDFEEQSDSAQGVAIDSQGRAVVVGTTDPVGGVDPLAIARYGVDGGLDTAFSADGRLVSMIAPEGHDVVTLPDDRIAVAGTVAGDFLAARFQEDGSPDSSFSGDGVQTIDFSDGADRAAALALDGTRLVVAGSARTAKRGFDFGVARLNAGGSLDRRFSEDGRRAISIGMDADDALSVAIDPTGDVVAAGSTERRTLDSGLLRLQGRAGG